MVESLSALGPVGKLAIARFRPVGVVRTGSTENRADIYRRFLDATTRAGIVSPLPEQAAATAEEEHKAEQAPLLTELSLRAMETGVELTCALQAVRLCAPVYVIESAERVVAAVPAPSTSESDFKTVYQEFMKVQGEFLEVARYDLRYGVQWWHLLRRYRERRFCKGRE